MLRIGYNIRQAFKQLRRNKGMSMASVFAITAMLLILGLFFVITVNINLFTEMLKNNYNEVEVFLKDEVTKSEAKQIMKQIETGPGIKSTEYRTKEEAMQILKARWGENSYLLDSLGDNPLPSSIIITVESMSAADKVIDKLDDTKGVEDVKYYQETVEKLTKITNFLKIAALIIMIFLIIVSVVVVSNTIKLTVFARAKEIEIMKYIGATNWFIRGPFLVEGILIGVISSIISATATYFIYKEIIAAVGKQFMTIMSSPLVPAGYLSINLILIFLAIGVSIGACGSIISMRKFLDTK
ncbi:MAG: permease-like cell division protein FtsX [Eubacterium sp.]|nr:permease-like cell division protein FtsX [Eubacterium sp.]